MQFGRCNICGKGGLLKVPFKKPSKRVIVCENEYQIHIKGALVDMLMKTERAELEEKEIVITADVVLN